jgi:DNA-directed RNA polymerase subunit M/transcription elongation factor TFIIS
MSEVKKCPKCGGEMERGYLITDGTQIRWAHEPHKLIMRGEVLMDVIPVITMNFKAHRCSDCKLILFNYEHLAPQPPSETPKTFLKKCTRCGKNIPLASEECPYCGAKQKKHV